MFFKLLALLGVVHLSHCQAMDNKDKNSNPTSTYFPVKEELKNVITVCDKDFIFPDEKDVNYLKNKRYYDSFTKEYIPVHPELQEYQDMEELPDNWEELFF